MSAPSEGVPRLATSPGHDMAHPGRARVTARVGNRDALIERLRASISRRQDLRPGSRAHWSNECEIKVLQRAMIDEPAAVDTAGPTLDRTST
jgi:hypothetical protein